MQLSVVSRVYTTSSSIINEIICTTYAIYLHCSKIQSIVESSNLCLRYVFGSVLLFNRKANGA